MVQGDLADITSLHRACQGATAIFSVTDFWHPFFDPANQAKLKPGQSINEFAYELELHYGKNIAIAAAAVPGLERYVYSYLESSKKWSKGKYTWVYHSESKAAVVDYIERDLPQLAAKMSLLHLGDFTSNVKSFGFLAPQKQKDGSFILVRPGDSEGPIPMVVASKDTGIFVRALIQASPGKKLLGYGSLISWKDYLALWTRLQGVRNGGIKAVSVKEMAELIGNVETMGREAAESYAYHEEFEFGGKDPDMLHPKDVSARKTETGLILADVHSLVSRA